MSYEQVKQYFSQNQLSDRVLHFEQSSATVEQAAAAVGCAPCQIAKTLSFRVQGEPVLIVAAGDAHSAVRLTPDELAELSHSLAWVDCCKDWMQG